MYKNIIKEIYSNISGFNGVFVGFILVFLLEYISLATLMIYSGARVDDFKYLSYFFNKFEFNYLINLSGIFFVFSIFFIRVSYGYYQNLRAEKLSKRIQGFINSYVFKCVISKFTSQEISLKGVGFYTNLIGDSATRTAHIFLTSTKILEGILSFTTVLLIIMSYSSRLFLSVVLFIFISSIFFLYILNYSRDSDTIFIESLNMVKTLRSLGATDFIKFRYDHFLNLILNNRTLVEKYRLQIKVYPVLILLLIALICSNPIYPLIKLTTLEVFSSILLLVRLFSALGTSVTSITAMYSDISSFTAVSQIFEFFSPKNRLDPSLSLNDDGKSLKIINLNLVNITHGFGAKQIFSEFKFEFLCGKSYAIVGPSGVGKSTLIDIISGHQESEYGSIYINGKLASAEDLVKNIVLVEQSNKLFSTSIRENILLGLNVDDVVIYDVLKVVDFLDYVLDLPDRLDTKIDYQSNNLSGGQIQRLAIARALIRTPDVLILDESTSAIDAASSLKILNNLIIHLKNSIFIYVTHDINLSSNADNLIDLKAINSHNE